MAGHVTIWQKAGLKSWFELRYPPTHKRQEHQAKLEKRVYLTYKVKVGLAYVRKYTIYHAKCYHKPYVYIEIIVQACFKQIKSSETFWEVDKGYAVI
jgi:hypothetical protein